MHDSGFSKQTQLSRQQRQVLHGYRAAVQLPRKVSGPAWLSQRRVPPGPSEQPNPLPLGTQQTSRQPLLCLEVGRDGELMQYIRSRL